MSIHDEQVARDVPEDLKPYYRRRCEMGVEVGCLFWGPRVVIPKQYRAKVLIRVALEPSGDSVDERIGTHACLVARNRFGYRTDSSQLPRLPECLKSANNSDSAPLASGHQGMGENPCRLCRPLYGVDVFSGGGRTH